MQSPQVHNMNYNSHRQTCTSNNGASRRRARRESDETLLKKRINQEITRVAEQNNLSLLLETIEGHLPEMNAVNLATSLHRLTKQVCHKGPQAIRGLIRHPAFLQLDAAIRHCILNGARSNEMKPYGFSVVTWSYAVLNKADPDLFVAIERISMTFVKDLKPFELANLAWGFAKTKQGSNQFFKIIAERLLQRAGMEFCLQDLAMIVWSFATAEQEGNAVELMFASIAKEMVSRAAMTSPQEIAITLWAFAKNQYKDIELFQAFANRMIQPHGLDNFKPQELSNTAWAFATLSLRHFTLFRQIAEVCVVKHNQMQPQAIANILWAFAKLQIDEPCSQALFRAFLSKAELNIAEYKQCELTATFWAATLIVPKCRHCLGFFHAVSDYCLSRSEELTPRVLVRFLGAAALLEGDLTYIFQSLATTSVRHLARFEPTFLCSLLRGHALAVHQQQDLSQAKEFWQRVHVIMHTIRQRLPEMTCSDLVHVCTSLEDLQKLEIEGLSKLDGSLFEAIQTTTIKNWGRLSNRNLRQLVSALLKSRCQLRPDFLKCCAMSDCVSAKDQALLQRMKPETQMKKQEIKSPHVAVDPWQAPPKISAQAKPIRPPPGLEDVLIGNFSPETKRKNSIDYGSGSTTCSSSNPSNDDTDELFQNSQPHYKPDTQSSITDGLAIWDDWLDQHSEDGSIDSSDFNSMWMDNIRCQ